MIILLESMIMKKYKLPHDLDSVQLAPEGEYRFRSTGVIVVGYELYDILDNNEARSERITELLIIFIKVIKKIRESKALPIIYTLYSFITLIGLAFDSQIKE